MDDKKIEAKLRKIKALAERGEGGEKEDAIKLYQKLAKKYHIQEEALSCDHLSVHWFSFNDRLEEDLLVQIFYMVTGDPEYHTRMSDHLGPQCGCLCTDFEGSEIRFYFEFYKSALATELEKFMMAFKIKNHLFPDETARCFSEEDEDYEITDLLIKAERIAEEIDQFHPVRNPNTSRDLLEEK